MKQFDVEKAIEYCRLRINRVDMIRGEHLIDLLHILTSGIVDHPCKHQVKSGIKCELCGGDIPFIPGDIHVRGIVEPKTIQDVTMEDVILACPVEREEKKLVRCVKCGNVIHVDDYGGEDKHGSYHSSCILKKDTIEVDRDIAERWMNVKLARDVNQEDEDLCDAITDAFNKGVECESNGTKGLIKT